MAVIDSIEAGNLDSYMADERRRRAQQEAALWGNYQDNQTWEAAEAPTFSDNVPRGYTSPDVIDQRLPDWDFSDYGNGGGGGGGSYLYGGGEPQWYDDGSAGGYYRDQWGNASYDGGATWGAQRPPSMDDTIWGNTQFEDEQATAAAYRQPRQQAWDLDEPIGMGADYSASAYRYTPPEQFAREDQMFEDQYVSSGMALDDASRTLQDEGFYTRGEVFGMPDEEAYLRAGVTRNTRQAFEDNAGPALGPKELMSGRAFQEYVGIDTGYMDTIGDFNPYGIPIGRAAELGIDTLTAPATYAGAGLIGAGARGGLSGVGRALAREGAAGIAGGLATDALPEDTNPWIAGAVGLGAGVAGFGAPEIGRAGARGAAGAVRGLDEGIMGLDARFNEPAYTTGVQTRGMAAPEKPSPTPVPDVAPPIQQAAPGIRTRTAEEKAATPTHQFTPENRALVDAQAAAGQDVIWFPGEQPKGRNAWGQAERAAPPGYHLEIEGESFIYVRTDADFSAPGARGNAMDDASYAEEGLRAAAKTNDELRTILDTYRADSMEGVAAKAELEKRAAAPPPPTRPTEFAQNPPPPAQPSRPYTYEEAPLGDSGIQGALGTKDATTRRPGAIGSRVGRIPGVKGIAGAINPSINLDRGIHVANQAEAAVRADLATRFMGTRAPLLEQIKVAFREAPTYIGPEPNPIRGTFIDIAENPGDYLLTPQQKGLLDEIAARDIENVNLARSEFSADVGLYKPKNEGAIYLPHINQNNDVLQRAGQAEASLGKPRIAKERVWDTARARAIHDPEFKPEVEAGRLIEAHDNAVAAAAGKETFSAGAGGLTKAEAMAEAFPALAKRRDDLLTKVDNLRARIETAEKRAGQNSLASEELWKAGAKIRDRAPDVDWSPLETALRQTGRRLDTLLTRRDAATESIASLKTAINTTQDQLDEIRKLWNNANLEGKGYVQNKYTFRYHTPEASNSIDKIKQTSLGPLDKVSDVAEISRATVLGADPSILTIQGQLNLWRDPISTAIGTVKMIIRDGGPSLADVARREPEMMSRYTQARARAFGRVADEFSTNQSLIARIPVARKLTDMEMKLAEVTQRLDYEAWKRTYSMLKNFNPKMTDEVAAHEAANALSKTNPALSGVERGLSPARAKAERMAITSTSFLAAPAMVVKDATSGIAKFIGSGGKWQSLSGREQIAIKHAITMAATIEGVSLASAVLMAEDRGMTPEQAVKRALNNGNKEFMAIQLPGGVNIPIGGPFRSFIRGVTPQNRDGKWEPPNLLRFANSKVAPLAGTQRDLIQNRDYQGNTIRKGDWWEQLLRVAEYEVEGAFTPLTGGAAAEGARLGQSPGEIGQNVLSQAAGTNVTFATDYDKRDVASRKRFDGRSYRDLNPLERQEIDRENGKAVSANPDAIKGVADTAALRDNLEKKQYEVDQAYGTPGLIIAEPKSSKDGAAWRAGYRGMQKYAAGTYDARETIDPFTGKPYGSEMDKAIAEWGKAIDASTTGADTDWDAVEAWKTKNPAQAALVDEYMAGKNNTDLTPMVSAYRADAKTIGESKYWEINDRVAKAWAQQKGIPFEEGMTADKYFGGIEAEVRKRIAAKGGTAKQVDLLTDQVMDSMKSEYAELGGKVRRAFRDANPEVADLLLKWGYYDPGAQETGEILRRDLEAAP